MNNDNYNSKNSSEKDLIAECVECRRPFTITSGEQNFFRQKGWPFPKRCALHRGKRRQEPNNGLDREPFRGNHEQ